MELEAFGTVAKLQRREEHVALVRAGIVGRRLLGGAVGGVELTIGKTFLARKLIVGYEVGREARGGTKHEAQTCTCLIAVVGTLACEGVAQEAVLTIIESCQRKGGAVAKLGIMCQLSVAPQAGADAKMQVGALM